MAETTHYGSWSNIIQANERGPQARLQTYLEEWEPYSDTLLDDITADYRARINALLPKGITLAGDLFYGPVADNVGRKVLCDMIRETVESIDLLEFITCLNEDQGDGKECPH